MTSSAVVSLEKVLDFFIKPRRFAASEDDAAALFAATRGTVLHGKDELVYWTWGEGPTVLLLHGWESRASHMGGFLIPLLRAGYRVVAVDAPAHGDSQGEETNVVDYGRAVVALARKIGEITAVIGHSVGSAAALFAFANGVRVQASVHISGPASMSRVIEYNARQSGMDTDGVKKILEIMVRKVGAPLEIMELENLASGMAHPAFIWHDPEDMVVPVQESYALSNFWKASTLTLVREVGHRRILRSQKVIESSVNFIEKTVSNSQHS